MQRSQDRDWPSPLELASLRHICKSCSEGRDLVPLPTPTTTGYCDVGSTGLVGARARQLGPRGAIQSEAKETWWGVGPNERI